MSLITLSEMQTYLGIPAADTNPTMNLEISNHISAVSEWIESMMGRTVALSTYSNFYDGQGINYDTIVLKAYPVGTVLAIYDSPTLTFITSETLIYKDDYAVDFDSGMIRLINGYRISKGYRNVRVDYTAGYSSTPEDIKLLTKVLVKEIYKDSQTSISNVESEQSFIRNFIGNNHFLQTIINKYRCPTS